MVERKASDLFFPAMRDQIKIEARSSVNKQVLSPRRAPAALGLMTHEQLESFQP